MAEHEITAYERSLGIMKAHAIVSIIFGVLGTVLGAVVTFAMIASGIIALSYAVSDSETSDAVITIISGGFLFIFAFIQQVFLIVSGVLLLRKPTPRVARGLVITNLVIGAMTNLVILILAIINLVQLTDYERGYKKR